MARKYSLAIHDLRLSEGDTTQRIINELLDTFQVPLTIHLVFDDSLSNAVSLLSFLKEKEASGAIELVFHGLTHRCSKNVSKAFVFYHKYQAEYLDDSEILRGKTREIYGQLTTMLSHKLGICPPCWILHRKNFSFFKTLTPLFIEKVLFIHYADKKVFSPVISLGSPNDRELIFLKGLGHLMHLISLILPNSRTRMAIHVCDLANSKSLTFFNRKVDRFARTGITAVLLRNLQ